MRTILYTVENAYVDHPDISYAIGTQLLFAAFVLAFLFAISVIIYMIVYRLSTNIYIASLSWLVSSTMLVAGTIMIPQEKYDPFYANVIENREELLATQDPDEEIAEKVAIYAELHDLDVESACDDNGDSVLCGGTELGEVDIPYHDDSREAVTVESLLGKDGDDLVLLLR